MLTHPSMPLVIACMLSNIAQLNYIRGFVLQFLLEPLPDSKAVASLGMSGAMVIDPEEMTPEEWENHKHKRNLKRFAALDRMKEKENYQTVLLMLANPELQPDTSPPMTPKNFEEFSKRRWEGACKRFRMRIQEWAAHYADITSPGDANMQNQPENKKSCAVA